MTVGLSVVNRGINNLVGLQFLPLRTRVLNCCVLRLGEKVYTWSVDCSLIDYDPKLPGISPSPRSWDLGANAFTIA